MTVNPYKVLGVDSSSKQEDIKATYRKLAKKFHPDLNPGSKKAESRFKEIASAYEQIGTKEDREKFDRGEIEAEAAKQNSRSSRGPFYNETQRGGGRYTNQFEGIDDDTLSSIFGQMGRRPPQPQIYELEVEFKDSVLGAEREVSFPSGDKVIVKIPPGVATGTKLRFAGKGDNGTDIYVQLNVKPSPNFKRVGKNLEMEFPVSFTDAILAREVKVPTIDGYVLMTIPRNVTSDQKVRVKGKGILDTATGTRGDQIAILKIKMPENVDDDFREAVEKWSERQAKESI